MGLRLLNAEVATGKQSDRIRESASLAKTSMDSTIQVEQFVDANTVAAHLKVTRRQVLEMTRSGILPGYPLGTGSSRRVWRYKLSEINAWVTAAGRKKSPDRALGQSTKTSTIPAAVPEVARREKPNG